MKVFIVKLSLIFFTLFGTLYASPRDFVDKSSLPFLPTELGEKLKAYNSFPLSWWNFAVVTFSELPSEELLQNKCTDLKRAFAGNALLVECGNDLGSYKQLAADWSHHFPLRKAISKEAFYDSLNISLSKISMTFGSSESEIRDIIRGDPFESYYSLVAQVQQKNVLNIKKEDGLFFDKSTNRLLVPVLMNFPPEDVSKTTDVMSGLRLIENTSLIGVHASTFENQLQVMEDVKMVSVVSGIVMLLFAVFLFVTKRYQSFLLIPPILVAIILSCCLTIIVFGSIHGLTISFGAGIIGLSFDYGFHSILNNKSKRVWYSNFVGLITTLVVLLVLMYSSIPLIQQMMLFSVLGLSFAFIIFFLLNRYIPSWYELRPLHVNFTHFQNKIVVYPIALLSAIGILLTPYFIEINLSLRQFDYQTKSTAELQRWIFSTLNVASPLFIIHSSRKSFEDILKISHDEMQWGKANSISVENIASYLPSIEEQRINLKSWEGGFCDTRTLSPTQAKIFSPFFDGLQCQIYDNQKANRIPKYLKHLHSNGNWITLFNPKNGLQILAIQEMFPSAISLFDLVSSFPRILFAELKWIVPISVFSVFFILFFYYRSFVFALVSILPFFVGCSFVLWGVVLFGLNVSFVSVMSFLMVFGLSIDYGIFACDALKEKIDDSMKRATWSSLIFSAITTVSGFFPLLFCRHPVLLQMGQTLTLGTLGTFLGALCLMPVSIKLLKKYRV